MELFVHGAGCFLQVQMMGGGPGVVFGPSDRRTFHPDLDWLQQQLKGPQKPKLVYLVNPCNPTGRIPALGSTQTISRGR